LLAKALRLLLYAMIPIAGLVGVLRRPLVDILFGGGKIGDPDLDRIATTLLWFLTGLAAHALIAVLARAFYARQDTLTPVLAAVAAVALNSSLAIALVGPLGLSGMALAIAIAAWVEAVLLAVVLRRRVPHLGLRDLGGVALEAIAGTLIAGAIAVGVAALIERLLGSTPTTLAVIGEGLVVTLTFGLVYAAVSLVLRIPELTTIVELMVDVVRRPFRS
jgi:putative peptidoglycan lipid II flippase